MTERLPWTVADTEDTYIDGELTRYRAVHHCHTQDEAEAWVNAYQKDDPTQKVYRGVFEICGPEEA